jgi:6-phosphogluconolactonase
LEILGASLRIKELTVFDSPDLLAEHLASELRSSVNNSLNNFFLSVSGGNSPEFFFKKLAQAPYKDNIDWDKLHFFWCDERCVSPDNPESNYGMTKRNLFDFISIPEKNIHRIAGEANPNEEVVRYTTGIEDLVPVGENGLPRFDRILLGLGQDGHTSSIFPGKNLLFVYSNIAGVAKHPETGQKRISLTKDVLNNGKRITFVVTGRNKAKVLSEILNNLPGSKNYPAVEIKPVNGILDWVIDKEAAFYL